MTKQQQINSLRESIQQEVGNSTIELINELINLEIELGNQ